MPAMTPTVSPAVAAARDAMLRVEVERFHLLTLKAPTAREKSIAERRVAVAREAARLYLDVAKASLTAPAPKPAPPKAPPRKHKLADAGGKWWEHGDLATLRKHVAERNRLLSSPEYRSIQAANKAALAGGPSRVSGVVEDKMIRNY